jgi:inosose dehydratase
VVLIGCGQLTWKGVPADEVMRQIVSAGYDGAPGPLSLERPAEEVVAWFGEFGLVPAPPYFAARFWEPGDESDILGQAEDVARYVRDLGCDCLYVAADGMKEPAPSGRTRSDAAGKVTPADAMTDEQFTQFGRVLGAFAEATLAEGVTSCFHNHVGTVIETAAELSRLLEHVPTDALALGLDTGHIAWAGDDAVAVCEQYIDRIATLHLKDVNETIRKQGVAGDWSYNRFAEAGVFAELGEGVVDFPAILRPLLEGGFDGWLIVETDITMKPTALESAQISRDYLKSIGL